MSLESDAVIFNVGPRLLVLKVVKVMTVQVHLVQPL